MRNVFKLCSILLVTVEFLLPLFLVAELVQTTTTLPKIGTQETLGKIENLEIEVVVQSPSSQETPLQIICVFEYTEGDIYNSPPALPKESNGMVHVDEALKGLITELRRTNRFGGHLLETLLITPPVNSLPARKLLMIGLGNRRDFKPDMMRWVGVTGMREALRLGVASYSHASDLKDAGIDSPTGDVAAYVVLGALEAFRTQQFLKQRGVSEAPTVTKITLLSGPAFFEDSKTGIRKVISSVSKSYD